MIQALVAAGDIRRDLPRVTTLASQLEETQLREGLNAGSWTYSRKVRPVGGADHANAYFAILGLRDADRIGVPVSVETWRRARTHWLASQNVDGSWSYKHGNDSKTGTGSMTSAGIEALMIAHERVGAAEAAFNDRKPKDGSAPSIDKPIEDGCRWLANHFSVEHNPGDGRWSLYYLDSLGRAGRITKRQVLVDSRGRKHDWYGQGSNYLIQVQGRFTGNWQDSINTDPIVGTSFALTFLSKGRIGD